MKTDRSKLAQSAIALEQPAFREWAVGTIGGQLNVGHGKSASTDRRGL